MKVQRDWRLNIESPAITEWKLQQEKEREQLCASLAPAQWDALAIPLAELIVARAKGRDSSATTPQMENVPEPIVAKASLDVAGRNWTGCHRPLCGSHVAGDARGPAGDVGLYTGPLWHG